jgi:serine/threonine protein phosphatase PrpC
VFPVALFVLFRFTTFSQSDECSPMIEDEVILCSKQPQLASVTGREEEYNLDKTVPPLSPPEKRMSKGKATKNHAFFAIYDGHGGSQAAECALKHTHKNVINSKYFETDPEAALMEAFAKTESDYLKITEEQKLDGLIGTTVCVALITGNVLYVANAGDSGAVLYKDGGTIVRVSHITISLYCCLSSSSFC